jgi:hypothetical protein
VCLPHDPKVHATCAPASIMGTVKSQLELLTDGD